MMKIVTVLGARPQFVKAATLSRIIKDDPEIQEIIVHTGQHYDENMSEVFFREMQIPKPHFSLEIISKLHGEMTSKMLAGVEKILLDEKPDVVMVYGDTNSTLAGALAASKLHIPIAHVEAGLRSFNRRMPEEINRVLTDHLSNWLFAPTDTAVEHLIREGIDEGRIHNVGDVMYDALMFYKTIASQNSDILNRLGLTNHNPYMLVTIHRAENTDYPERLNLIFEQLTELSQNKKIVLPLHPRTKSYLKRDFSNSNFMIIDPVGYFDMIQLQTGCQLIITDSGGVQKEAFFNNKFCVTVRDETEWTELVKNGFNFLARPISSLAGLVESVWSKKFNSEGMNFYGEGSAANDIVTILKKNKK